MREQCIIPQWCHHASPLRCQNTGMKFQRIIVPLVCSVLIVAAYRSYSWPGVGLAAGALVMWVLLHFTRMLQVLKRAAHRPVGAVDSAVMLNARLRSGMTLLHVVAMTRALGEQISPKEAQPEIYRWRDAGASSVTCHFGGGKLARWELQRPIEASAGEVARNTAQGTMTHPLASP